MAKLNKKQKYLQIALNSTLEEARNIISQLPLDKRIIIEDFYFRDKSKKRRNNS